VIVAIDFLEQNKMSNKQDKSTFFIFNLVIQFFIETFVAMVIGYFIGKYLDQWLFSDKVLFVYILVVIGIFAGISNFIKRALKYSKGEEENEEKRSD
jgi:F0F1-type ATP synthase assembly protein I